MGEEGGGAVCVCLSACLSRVFTFFRHLMLSWTVCFVLCFLPPSLHYWVFSIIYTRPVCVVRGRRGGSGEGWEEREEWTARHGGRNKVFVQRCEDAQRVSDLATLNCDYQHALTPQSVL